MSTRANIIISDEFEKLYFYRHSDGYPEHTFEDLKEFCNEYKIGRLRNNASQSAGWLVIRGHKEYWSKPEDMKYMKWKVGAYEPTSELHGDIEYLYLIDLNAMILNCFEITGSCYKDEDYMGDIDEMEILTHTPIKSYYFGDTDKTANKVEIVA